MRSRLRDALERGQKDGVAIGHFNVGEWAEVSLGRNMDGFEVERLTRIRIHESPNV
jgi:hypothetical protein